MDLGRFRPKTPKINTRWWQTTHNSYMMAPNPDRSSLLGD